MSAFGCGHHGHRPEAFPARQPALPPMTLPALALRALAVLVLTAFAPAHADDLQASLAQVARLHDALVAMAAVEPPLDQAARYARLAPVILATHDLERMARYAAGRAWRAWSDAERAAFAAAFERLSIATYASRFATIGRENFEIVGAEPDRTGTVRVRALIHRVEGEPVALDYVLEAPPASADGEATAGIADEAAAAPRIVMVYNDGVSELSIKRAEYSAILESGNLEALLAEIGSQTANLR